MFSLIQNVTLVISALNYVDESGRSEMRYGHGGDFKDHRLTDLLIIQVNFYSPI
jgi:hypothetical protein